MVQTKAMDLTHKFKETVSDCLENFRKLGNNIIKCEHSAVFFKLKFLIHTLSYM